MSSPTFRRVGDLGDGWSSAENSGNNMHFDLQVWYGMISCQGRRV
jgi:hypothetical protein